MTFHDLPLLDKILYVAYPLAAVLVVVLGLVFVVAYRRQLASRGKPKDRG